MSILLPLLASGYVQPGKGIPRIGEVRAGNDAQSCPRDRHKDPEVMWGYRQLAAWLALDGDCENSRWAAQMLFNAQPESALLSSSRVRPIAFQHLALRHAELADCFCHTGSSSFSGRTERSYLSWH
jgi:hypothetical protein